MKARHVYWCAHNLMDTFSLADETIDFQIHLSYKTGNFEALYKIPNSSTTTNNQFIGILLIIFHYRKNMNMGSSLKF